MEKPCLTHLLDRNANEFYLFHGTKPDVIDIVKKDGFDERVGRVNGMFGAGVYFAENASKSNQYIPCSQCGKGSILTKDQCECKETSEKSCQMLLCRVVLGDVHVALKYEKAKYQGTDPR
jgi:hypothetical protein